MNLYLWNHSWTCLHRGRERHGYAKARHITSSAVMLSWCLTSATLPNISLGLTCRSPDIKQDYALRHTLRSNVVNRCPLKNVLIICHAGGNSWYCKDSKQNVRPKLPCRPDSCYLGQTVRQFFSLHGLWLEGQQTHLFWTQEPCAWLGDAIF